MSHKSQKKQKYAKRYTKHIVARHAVTVLSLIALLIVGLVSTTFASFVSQPVANEGTLIADVQTAVVNRNDKNDLADTKANADIAQTNYNHNGTNYLYFIKPSSWTGSTVTYIVGHDSYYRNYAMTRLSENLYYLNVPSFGGWNGWGFHNVSSTTSDNTKVWDKVADYSPRTNLNWNYEMKGGTHVAIGPATSGEDFSINYNDNTTGIAAVNLSQTAHSYASAGDGTYSANVGAGSITITSYALTDHGSGSSSTETKSSTNSSVSKDAALGTTVTMTATPSTGYSFIGWFDSTSATSAVSTSTTYTYQCDSAKTMYARFQSPAIFKAGDVVYFDIRDNTSWTNASAKMFVQFDNSTSGNTGNRAEMTKIGTYLYMYRFTSNCYSTIRFWRGNSSYQWNYSKELDSSNGNGVYLSSGTSVSNGSGTEATFSLTSISTPTLTAASTDILIGNSVSLSCSTPVLNYKLGSTSYTTTPTGVSYTFSNDSSTISTNTTGSFTWTPNSCNTYDLTVRISATSAGLTSSASSAVTVTVRPADPTALTLSALNYISGTGTTSDPYIGLENRSFKISGKATVASNAQAYYSTSENGTYSATSSFAVNENNKGTQQSIIIYARACSANILSKGSKNATAYYMVFTSLDGDNTGFILSDNDITDIESVTLSGAYVDEIADAELSYIKQTYQVSANNSTYTDLSSDASCVWTPDAIGTYYFRVKTENTATGEVVYSASQTVNVTQSTVYYSITVTNDNTTYSGAVTLKTNGTTITNGQILSNSPLSLTITRPDANKYFQYIKVNGKNVLENHNGDVTDEIIIEHVKENVIINYKLLEKPKVNVEMPKNAKSISFKYISDGSEKTASSAGEHCVDYGSDITYSVTPNSGFYVTSMTGVDRGPITSSTVTGTKENVTSSIENVNATLTANNTFRVNIDTTSVSTTGASISVDGSAVDFSTDIPLNYGAEATVVITPPNGCYALVTGESVSSEISTDGKATFKVKLTGANKTFIVKFVENPKIYIEQPQYGSIYVTSGTENSTRYYFHGEAVGYGTELTVHVKPDNGNSKLKSVLVNDQSIGTTDGSKFNIVSDSTTSATIDISVDHTFSTSTEYGNRRIFFTDNSGWGDGQVMVHYSNSDDDTNFNDGNTKAMTYKYTNDVGDGQRVYYADIPYGYKYVNFYKKSATSNYTDSALIDNKANAFYHDGGNTAPYGIHTWQESYSDYVATDRVTTIQQGVALKNEAAVFEYTCDFGDAALTAEVIAGNDITYDFDKGKLYITPTDNALSFTLVKVKSEASSTVKYYLIRVDNFELVSFDGIQKIYSTSILNNLQFNVVVKGGAPDYTSKLFISDTNKKDSYEAVTSSRESGFAFMDGIKAYVNSLLVEYNIHTINGVKYYMVEAKDDADRIATSYLKTLFGTNTNTGEKCLYFYNATGEELDNYNVRACFTDNSNNRTFVTMQRVGDTNYYRATVPYDRTKTVDFYICNSKTFSNDYDDYNTDEANEIYSFKAAGLMIPANENIVYTAVSFNGSVISGSFTEFDY